MSLYLPRPTDFPITVLVRMMRCQSKNGVGVQILAMWENRIDPAPSYFPHFRRSISLPVRRFGEGKEKPFIQPIRWAKHAKLCDLCRSRNAIIFKRNGPEAERIYVWNEAVNVQYMIVRSRAEGLSKSCCGERNG